MQGIYAIVNTTSGKRYVGSAVCIEKRWETHRSHLNNGTHHTSHLLRAWKKYGASAFTWEVLEEVTDATQLLAREQFWIDATPLAMRYNSSPTAGSNLGVTYTPEVRRKHAVAWLGKHHSEATKAKLSAAKKGIARPHHQVEATAAALRGRKRPKEVVERIAAANRGKTLTDEHRQKLSAAKQGKHWTETQRAAILAAKAARPITDETRRKLSEASRRYNRQYLAKLTPEQAATIRERVAAGEKQRDVAAAFGIHQSTVWAIAHNETWK